MIIKIILVETFGPVKRVSFGGSKMKASGALVPSTVSTTSRDSQEIKCIHICMIFLKYTESNMFNHLPTRDPQTE